MLNRETIEILTAEFQPAVVFHLLSRPPRRETLQEIISAIASLAAVVLCDDGKVDAELRTFLDLEIMQAIDRLTAPVSPNVIDLLEIPSFLRREARQ